jgi:cytidyltransferase-like protein
VHAESGEKEQKQDELLHSPFRLPSPCQPMTTLQKETTREGRTSAPLLQQQQQHSSRLSMQRNDAVVPTMGPEPTLLSRKQVDALYETLAAVRHILDVHLKVDFIVTGGSLLGAVRQHSILFCDDDVDIAILEKDHDHPPPASTSSSASSSSSSSSSVYSRVSSSLQQLLNAHFPNDKFLYQIRPWEAGDRIRHGRFNNVFVDLFTIRRYETLSDFEKVISVKANGSEQSAVYVQGIVHTVQQAAASFSQQDENDSERHHQLPLPLSLCPFYHFDTRKAIELWPKEVYRHDELFPLNRTFKMGPLDQIPGPRMPILLLKRAFGPDCFRVYYQSASHHADKNNINIQSSRPTAATTSTGDQHDNEKDHESSVGEEGAATPKTNRESQHLPPHVCPGGTWQDSRKIPLQPQHYIPLQPTLRAARRPTLHNLQSLELYLQEQSLLEDTWMKQQYQQHEQQEDVRSESTTAQVPVSTTTTAIDKEEPPDYSTDTRSTSTGNDDVELRLSEHSGGTEAKERITVVEQPRVPASQRNGHHHHRAIDAGSTLSTNDSNNHPPLGGQSRRHQEQRTPRPRKTVYMDGVFDLFHVGHLNAIRQCAALGDVVIIGVTGDDDAARYKRPPIISQDDRTAILRALSEVDDVICPCPLIVTRDFMTQHGIDLVVHGFCNEDDAERQKEFFAVPIELGQFQRIPYYLGSSTTDIMKKIIIQNENCSTSMSDKDINHNNGAGVQRLRNESLALSRPQWFGATIAACTDNAATIPYDPFPVRLRLAVEPHIRKAAQKNQESMDAIRQATGEDVYNAVLADFGKSGLAREVDFEFDTSRHHILPSFLAAMDLPSTFQLGSLHHYSSIDDDNFITKDRLLYTLSQNWSSFQLVYDEFVRKVCIPHLASILRHSQRQHGNQDGNIDDESFYYQSFPCVRMIQPNEFSIGPHADVAYGHHPCTINFYLPLTEIGGTSALFLETRPGSQDWHPIQGVYGT